MNEMSLEWRKIGGLWRPYLDDQPLATIHFHSKALDPFVSDRPDYPVNDFDVDVLVSQLQPDHAD